MCIARAVFLWFLAASLAFSQAPLAARSDSSAEPNPDSPPSTDGAPPRQSAALIFKSIITPTLVDDMFGHRISMNYLAIQVTVFNTSEDEDLLINDVSVDYTALQGQGCAAAAADPLSPGTGVGTSDSARKGQKRELIPLTEKTKSSFEASCQMSSQELTILRGVAEKGQAMDPRNIAYRSLQAVGTIGGSLTGVAGLGEVLPRAVAAFNGPGLTAFATAFPDYTVHQMNRLSDAAYAANTVVAKQRSKILVAFIPLHLFFNPKGVAQFRKDPYSAFVKTGDDNSQPGNTPLTLTPSKALGGLKDLKVRVAYNFIVSTADVPPKLDSLSIADEEIVKLLQKQPVQAVIVGRFLDGATVTSANPDLDVALDGAQASTDKKLYLILTPKKAMFPAKIELIVKKGKDSSNISVPVTAVAPVPALTKLEPSVITQGSDQQITLTGENFFDLPPTLAFSVSGAADTSIAVGSVKVISSTTIVATISARDVTAPKTLDVAVVVGARRTGTKTLTVNPR